MDFDDDKEFSKKFLVVTNDKLKAQLKINKSFRDYVNKIPLKEFIIEIKGHNLIIGNKKVITEDTVLLFANFLNELSSSF